LPIPIYQEIFQWAKATQVALFFLIAGEKWSGWNERLLDQEQHMGHMHR
jgi:hypothetical protein